MKTPTGSVPWITDEVLGGAGDPDGRDGRRQVRAGMTAQRCRLDEALNATRRRVITEAVRDARGNITHAARALGVGRNSLYWTAQRLDLYELVEIKKGWAG